MRRVLLILLMVVVLLPVVVVALVLGAANSGPGERLIERLTAQFTGGTVVLAGVGGRFLDAPRIARIEIRDADGVWLTIDDAALDWSPLRLLRGDAWIDRLTARRVVVARLPVSQPSSGPSTPFTLPVQVDGEVVQVGRVEVGAAVAGVAAVLSVDGQKIHLTTLTEGSGAAQIRRLDGGGAYDLSAEVGSALLRAKVEVDEPAGGLLGRLAHLPDLGALAGQVTMAGPWSAVAETFSLHAGLLQASSQGKIDFSGQTADVDVSAHAPAMTPAPGVSWQSVALDGHVHGSFSAPDADGTLDIAALEAGGARVARISAKVAGNAGHVGLQASVDGVLLPGPKPDVLAGAPMVLQADMRLDDPARPAVFTLKHPLVALDGSARLAAPLSVQARLNLPDLAPLAAVGGVLVDGKSALQITASMAGDVTSVAIDGGVSVTGGMAPLPGLVGDATIGVSAAVAGNDFSLSRLVVDGAAVKLEATGGLSGGVAKVDWQLALSRLAVLAPNLAGRLRAQGQVYGLIGNFAAQADVGGEVQVAGFKSGAITASLSASGLPAAPEGRLNASGELAGAPLSLAVTAQRGADGALGVSIERAGWKSITVEGGLQLAAGATLPTGHINMAMARLADLRPLLGLDLSGQVRAEADLSDPHLAKVTVEAGGLAVPGVQVGAASLVATVRDATEAPVVGAKLRVEKILAGGVGGQAQLEVNGPLSALGTKLDAGLTGIDGAAAQVAGTALVNATARSALLSTTDVKWKGENLRLLAPVRVSFADGVLLDRLRLGLGQAELQVAGRVSPTLDVTASLRGVTPDLARVAVPSLQADGSLQAEVRLTGTMAVPAGTIRATASGLRMRSGPGRGLPAADVTLTATLQGRSAQVDARMSAGSTTRLSVSGSAPLSASGALDLRSIGKIDLVMLDPILSASGRRVRGHVTLDGRVSGTAAAPELSGSLLLSKGEVQDIGQGVHLTDIEATVSAAGSEMRLERFHATAGPGTIDISGSVGALAAGIPVDIKITARNARPVASDLLTANLDADLSVRGAASAQMAVAGSVHVRSANIQIPDQLPTSVAVLNVRVAGQKPPPPPSPPPDIALDVSVTAPQGIFVRGHGLDAEMSGDLHVGGTAANPQLSKGFQLVRGLFSLAGVTLTFSSGEVTFNGAGRFVPSINFVATSANSSVTATLTISGYADAPKIALSSVPDLPQDQILAQLLFHQSAASLSPFQLAEIAAALAQISGVSPGTDDVLGKLRGGLGLDQLNVGSNATGAPTLNAGRYVAPGVYVGAKQGIGTAGTQATVQIDIFKGLKVETDVGSGTGGNSVGLTYQFDY
jgi:translocation and assembly module TamB